MYSLLPVPNGPITTSVRLACALQYFAGSSLFELRGKCGVFHSEVMQSVWYVVEAVINLTEFDIQYPDATEKQDKIAREFNRVSMVLLMTF